MFNKRKTVDRFKMRENIYFCLPKRCKNLRFMAKGKRVAGQDRERTRAFSRYIAGTDMRGAENVVPEFQGLEERTEKTRIPSVFEKIAADPDRAARTRAGRKTLRELAQIIGGEWVDYTTDDGTVITMPRDAVVLYRFYESAMKKPTAQKLLALQKIRGEDVFRITTEQDSDHRGSLQQLTGELNGLIKAINYRAHTTGAPSDGASKENALEFVNYDVIEEDTQTPKPLSEHAKSVLHGITEAKRQAAREAKQQAKNENKPQISPKNE